MLDQIQEYKQKYLCLGGVTKVGASVVPDLEIGLEIGFVEAPLDAGEEVF